MTYLDRYLYRVKKLLPKKDKEDTINELESLLLEQIDDLKANGLSEEAAEIEAIKEMGEPSLVAANYISDIPIIAREVEPYLYVVMKIIALVLPIGILIADLISYLSESIKRTTMEILIHIVATLPHMVMGVITAYGILFVVLLVNKRVIHDEISKQDREFNPEKLPKIPSKEYDVKLGETIFEIIGGSFFIYILNFNQGLISIYFDGNQYPLLNDHFNTLLPFINIGVLFGIGISIFHLFYQRKTIYSGSAKYLQQLYSAIILFFLASAPIFTNDIISTYDLEIVPVIFKVLLIIGGIGTVIGSSVQFIKLLLAKD